jgi:urea carboxylase
MLNHRERVLLQEWENERSASASVTEATESLSLDDEDVNLGTELTSSLFATIWKINFKPGDVIPSDDAVVVVLEAMKTEIPILAGEGNSGKKVVRLGRGTKEGGSVVPGEVLVVLA